ncbi:hypothetical protein CCR85_14540 [Rhodothalassium salexigens]|uniref:AMP-binding protein n=1 Tax=Rhodothalassium salexigens TaxID=1086 RepID=UPI001911B26E|nr:AMP-binding protein [Rhodothalassium salexigens]MBK5912698.1 hypothetical protein [Rhodothalassium salexigens]
MALSTAPAMPLAALAAQARARHDRPHLVQPRAGGTRTYRWADTDAQVRQMAASLRRLGLAPGDRVAILSKNCAEWVLADLAILAAGLVSVPIYPTAGAETIAYVLDHAEVKAIFLGKLDDPAAAHGAIPGGIARIALPYPTAAAERAWDDLLGADALDGYPDTAPDELATLVYTSGSTGTPKGVMLSHGNLAFAADTTRAHVAVAGDERLLSHLPLAHIAERSLGEGVSLYAGTTLYFVEALDTFARDLAACRPTRFLTVPRLWAKLQEQILARVPEARLRRMLAVPGLSGAVKRKIKTGLGLDRARFFGTGAAPAPPALLAFFHRLDMPVAQGFGMTETAGVATAFAPEAVADGDPERLTSVGPPLPGMAARLGADDELELKGPGVFPGYYKAPDLTAESFTADGWFKTGDLARMDDQGHIWITGRRKELFKTAKAKYVSPVPIEAKLAECTLFENLCVLGAGLPQPEAVAVLTDAAARRPADEVDRLLETVLAAVNDRLEPHERLARLHIVPGPWDVASGLLTPTLKLRRGPIETAYAALLGHGADQSRVIRHRQGLRPAA